MNWLEQFVQQSQAASNEALSRIAHALHCLVQSGNDTTAATTGTARSLAYQFGAPPSVQEAGERAILHPRHMSAMPVIFEATTTPEQIGAVRLDVLAELGRLASAGFYANLGENAFRVQLIGLDGRSSAPHTLPPGATVQLGCLVSEVLILPGEDGPAFYQVYAL